MESEQNEEKKEYLSKKRTEIKKDIFDQYDFKYEKDDDKW